MLEILNKLKRKLKMIVSKKSVNDDIVAKREQHIKSIMSKTGWTRKETVENVKNTHKRIGITYADFDKYDFYKVPEEKFIEEYINILANKKLKTKKARIERMNKKRILIVVANTGWDYYYAKDAMEKSKAISGASYQNYISYRFWELNEDTQKTYLTKGIGKALKEKYNIEKSNKHLFINKNEFNKVFANFIGRPWLCTASMTFNEFIEKFNVCKKIIYKPLSASCGKGVTVFDLDESNKEFVYKTLLSFPSGIVEGYIQQHFSMSRYSLKSVNTIRVVTIRLLDKVNILYAALRMGGGDSVVDNMHAGGIVAVININTGVVITEGIDADGNIYENHPSTNEKIKGFKIPYWNEVVKLVNKASKVIDGINYIGWDIAITETGPVIVEGNTSPESGILQEYYAKQHKGMKYVVEKYL